MSETPGDDAPKNEAEQPGYWEQQAQGAAQQPGPGPGYGYGYGAGYVPPGQPGNPPYPQYPIYGYPRPHPDANKVMALGLVGVVGGMACYLPILVAPFAWVMGNRVVREIEAAGAQLGGRSEAQTGRILGIIGTVLLTFGVLALVLLIVLAVGGVFDETGNSNV
jgi:hypothetical protein